jgi:uncharacterized tellurite resistance protein B-like protein
MKFGELIGMFKESNKFTKSHMKNLFEMAMIDSHFDDSEYELLEKLAKKHKVSVKELNKIKEDPSQIEFELPNDKDEKFEQFFELVHMMAIDENIFDEEMNLCKIFAKKFGYNNGVELVKVIAQNIGNGQNWKETKTRVDMYKMI